MLQTSPFPPARNARIRADFFSRPALRPALWRPPPLCLRCGRKLRQCTRCGLPTRSRRPPPSLPGIRPPWRAPVRPRYRPFADVQSGILTAPGSTSILTDGLGNIIDDPAGSGSNCCCGCPSDCYVPRVAEEVCRCIPLRILIVVAGWTLCDPDCFISDTGAFPPHAHTKVAGNANITVCTTDPPLPGETYPRAPVSHTSWGNDGPPDCAPPTSLTDAGIGHWSGGMSFGVVVQAQLTIWSEGGFVVTFFDGLKTFGSDCEGPWTVPNMLGGCGYNGVSTIGGHGGTATFYKCAC